MEHSSHVAHSNGRRDDPRHVGKAPTASKGKTNHRDAPVVKGKTITKKRSKHRFDDSDDGSDVYDNRDEGLLSFVSKTNVPKKSPVESAPAEKPPARPPENANGHHSDMCIYFGKGYCKNGDSCRFSHVRVGPLRAPSTGPDVPAGTAAVDAGYKF